MKVVRGIPGAKVTQNSVASVKCVWV